MPYIDEKSRYALSYNVLKNIIPENSGELNYCFTVLITNYLEGKGKKYQYFNDIIGALEGAKLEVYRRLIAPYEDDKKLTNGDVYLMFDAFARAFGLSEAELENLLNTQEEYKRPRKSKSANQKAADDIGDILKKYGSKK